ncbi:MAG: NAD-dependent epimerase/dehydratase family protein [Chthoniobacterales bacterium]|jgi:UDP-glucose 4-epimerase|nr:NAD-dependent epimerase/dehydratase family protein [Chthoniobacterales bacterium]
MKIAITGARGRLGKLLRCHFEALGHDVLAFSRNADAAHRPLVGLLDKIEEDDMDVLLHLAWSTVPTTAEVVPGVEWREDLPLLASMLSSLAKRQSKDNRSPLLVFFSSCAVYGEPKDTQVFKESDEVSPKGWYAAGKLAAEQLITRFHQEEGVRTLILRVTNPYGFSQGQQHLQGVIPALVSAAQSGKPFVSWGDGQALKDYLHVADFCSALDLVIQMQPLGMLNLGSGSSVTLQQVIEVVESASGASIDILHEPARPWDVTGGRYSKDAVHAHLGWQPEVTLTEGIRQCVSAMAG